MKRWYSPLVGLAVVCLASACALREIPYPELRADYGLPSSQTFVASPGVNVHYTDDGRSKGRVIILVHGFAASVHAWRPWIDRLKDDYRLVAIDLPGGPAFVRAVQRIHHQPGINRVGPGGVLGVVFSVMGLLATVGLGRLLIPFILTIIAAIIGGEDRRKLLALRDVVRARSADAQRLLMRSADASVKPRSSFRNGTWRMGSRSNRPEIDSAERTSVRGRSAPTRCRPPSGSLAHGCDYRRR